MGEAVSTCFTLLQSLWVSKVKEREVNECVPGCDGWSKPFYIKNYYYFFYLLTSSVLFSTED